jgi:hypothetical protein
MGLFLMSEVPLYERRPETPNPNPRTPTPKAESRHEQVLARAMNGDPPSLASLGAGAGQPDPLMSEVPPVRVYRGLQGAG